MIAANQFIGGALLMANAVAALFFFRFWRRTRDRLFALFGVAFVILGLNRLALFFVIGGENAEPHTAVYVVRLIAFVLILVAVLDKNRGPRQPNRTEPQAPGLGVTSSRKPS